MAFSRWQYPHTLTAEQKAEREAKSKEHQERPEGSNRELMDEFFGQLFEGRRKWIVPEETFCECAFFPCGS